MRLQIVPIPAFKDNYIWAIIHPQLLQVIIVDPGDAEPIRNFMAKHQLRPIAILLTHHHWDHSDGIPVLRQHYPQLKVYGPSASRIADITHPVREGDEIIFAKWPLQFKVLEIPGHTLDHIAYYNDEMLFCGDTLFAAGCGRVFEGTYEQMFASLAKLAALPDQTRVYCAHEYTLANLGFALQAEPDNTAVSQRIADITSAQDKSPRTQPQQSHVTLPSTIALEKKTNPFLRTHLPSLQQAVHQHCNIQIPDALATFIALRKWKNNA